MPSLRGSIGALAILFAALPFGFALIRAVNTGYDLRYLWVALASLLGATIVMKLRRNGGRAGLVLASAAFFMSTLLAVVMALLLGTRLGPGIIVVASAFGFCSAVGWWLYLRS
jgi:hypothetical protein